jgi:hypothetical protein
MSSTAKHDATYAQRVRRCVFRLGGAAPGVRVRDTTDRAGALLAISARAWRAFLAEIRA